MKQTKYSDLIREFLIDNPVIAPKRVEEILSLPATTIAQTGRDIPAKHIFPLLCFLAQYGLKIDGYTLTYDPQTDSLFGRKFVENVDTEEEGQGFVYIVKEYRTFWSSYEDLF